MTQQNETINGGLNALFGGTNPQKDTKGQTRHSDIVLPGHGRPRKNESVSGTENDMRTSLIVNKDTYDKMRIIAVKECLTLKEVLDSAFHLAIERYEAKHGPISGTMVRTAKEDLFK